MSEERAALAAEPITLASAAAFVGLALLEGAIGYVGGRLMASALGDPSISDIRAWIEHAVAELKAFVSAELRRQLDQRVMEQMRADLQGIMINIYQYASLDPANRQANRYLVETCDTATARLVALSFNYDQALFITTTAVAYRLFTLHALYELDGDAGHIRSAKPLMDEFLKEASASRDRLGHEMAPSTHFKINCGIIGEHEYTCIGLRDGTPITPRHHAPERINGRLSFIVMREAIQRSWEPIVGPLQKQTDEFLRQANTSIELARDCYVALCKKVGEDYEFPAGASPTLNIGRAAVPELVTMPGAMLIREG